MRALRVRDHRRCGTRHRERKGTDDEQRCDPLQGRAHEGNSFPGVRAPIGTTLSSGSSPGGAPGGRFPLPRGFVQPVRRRGRPGSPIQGSQLRDSAGFRPDFASATRLRSNLSRADGLGVSGRTSVARTDRSDVRSARRGWFDGPGTHLGYGDRERRGDRARR